MEPPFVLLAFSIIILGLGVVMLTVFGGNAESRISKLEHPKLRHMDELDMTAEQALVNGLDHRLRALEDIHKWGNWHDE